MIAKKPVFLAIFCLFTLPYLSNSAHAITYLEHDFTEINLFDACTYYNLRNWTELSNLRSDTLTTYDKKEIIGRIKNEIWEYEVLIPYTSYELVRIDDVFYPNCTIDNKTLKEVCYNDIISKEPIYNEVIRYRNKWLPFASYVSKYELDISTRLKKTQKVRYCADIERVLTNKGFEIKVDHIPKYNDVIYSSMTWWNDSLIHKREVKAGCTACSGDVSIPVLINDTAIVLQNENEYLWCNFTVTNSLDTVGYVYYNDEVDLACSNADETIQVGNSMVETNHSRYGSFNKDLVGWYHLNGTDAYDSSQYYNNIQSVIGTPSARPGVIGNGIFFDGSGDWLDFPNVADMNGLARISVCGWYNATATSNNVIASKHETINVNNYGWILQGGGDGKFYFGLSNGGGSWIDAASTTTYSTNTWYFVCGTYDNENVRIYINAVLEDTDPGASGNINSNTIQFIIGARGTSGDRYEMTGELDEIKIYNITLSQDEITAMYNNTIGTHSFSTIEPEQSLSINNSMLGFGFNTTDFSLASSDYINSLVFNFSLTNVSNISILSTMNVEKITGPGTNIVSVRILYDDTVVLGEDLRTVSSRGDIGSVGTSPILIQADSGEHNITYQFKRTGSGIINITNFDFMLLNAFSNNGYPIRINITTLNYTHSATDFTTSYNFTVPKTSESKTYYAIKQTIYKAMAGSSVCSYYFQDLGDSLISPYWQRFLEDENDIGSISGVYIDPIDSGNLEYTIQSKQTDPTDTIFVEGSLLNFDMVDSSLRIINGWQTSNPLTNLTNNITLEEGTHNIANFTFVVDNGDSYYLSTSVSFKSGSGEQTPSIFINTSNISETECYSKKSRYLEDNNDIGNAFIYTFCDGIIVSSEYQFNLYVVVPAGESLTILDESFNGFEIKSIESDLQNTAPIVAISNPETGEIVTDTINITWITTDLQGNKYLTNITIINESFEYEVATQLPDSDSSYLFDTNLIADGTYDLIVLSYENETLELLNGNNSIIINIDNIIPAELETSATFCLTSDILYTKTATNTTENGVSTIETVVSHTFCNYGCSNNTLTTLGNAGCIESDFLLALFFIIAIILIVVTLKGVFKA